MDKIINPHDKLFREAWSNKKDARSFLENYLPADVLELIDLDSLEISKDSFIEEDLKDYYSDLLYKVNFEDDDGYVYLLFEHKSFKDNFIHLQLFGYINDIWKLHVRQTKEKYLPIIIPLVLYHGKTKWDVNTSLSSLISGPYEKLKAYIPDFRFILYDLTRFSDDEIKGTVLSRIILLLFKHIFDDDIVKTLPEIFSLFNDHKEQHTGLQYIETFQRY
ncbi:MAG: Rpn family recombination-promoting nuclease/putative transposase [Desulfobacterales bacterium]|nr:Rpn family recombination-promoting nuclease/putative transposase [Desulfobacterales bacterium]